MTTACTQITATTRDIGLAIRDHLEARNVEILPSDDRAASGENARLYIEAVDASDPDNILVYGENGQRFRVRVFAA